MRFALLALCLSACLIESPSGDDDYYPPPSGGGWGSGYGGTGGDNGYGCRKDTECAGGLVCARNGECMSASSVRVVHVNWTVGDQVASDASCVRSPDLAITFSDAQGSEFGFAPVPCDAGRFTVDKMPLAYTRVQLSRVGEYSGGASGMFDSAGDANLDLPY